MLQLTCCNGHSLCSKNLTTASGKANTLHALGRVRHAKKDFVAAADFFQKALTQWEDLDHRGGQVEVLISQGELISEHDGPQQALVPYRKALDIARQMKNPLDEAQALEGIAQCQLLTGQRDTANTTLREAMTIYERLGIAEGRTGRF